MNAVFRVYASIRLISTICYAKPGFELLLAYTLRQLNSALSKNENEKSVLVVFPLKTTINYRLLSSKDYW